MKHYYCFIMLVFVLGTVSAFAICSDPAAGSIHHFDQPLKSELQGITYLLYPCCRIFLDSDYLESEKDDAAAKLTTEVNF